MSQTNPGQLLREVYLALRQSIIALLAWLIGYPLTLIVPRDRRLTIVIGRRGAVFADNSKYFFAYATDAASKNERVIFLGSSTQLVDQICAAGGRACHHPSWRSLLLVLRCGRIVVDMADWIDFGVFPLSRGAQTIQLWHGAPLKWIELDQFRHRKSRLPAWTRPLLALQKTILGRYPLYDTVVATSQGFIDQAFSRSFSAREFIATGYPRNDILLEQPTKESVVGRLAWINVDRDAIDSAERSHRQGRKNVLYVPTFRGSKKSPFDGPLDLVRLDAFAGQHGLLVFIKLHPFMHGLHGINQHDHLIECAPLSDIYPLMKECDILITDYSSIYFDFLILNRPVVFFPYDLEQYVAHDRSLYFHYESMAPGPHCRNQDELEQTLEKLAAPDYIDIYSEKRTELLHFTHDHTDFGAVPRLLNHIR